MFVKFKPDKDPGGSQGKKLLRTNLRVGNQGEAPPGGKKNRNKKSKEEKEG